MDLRSIGSAVPTAGEDSAGQGRMEYRGCRCGGSADSADIRGRKKRKLTNQCVGRRPLSAGENIEQEE
mgnify:CR=1 FL=1